MIAMDVLLMHVEGLGLDELLALGLAASGALAATLAFTRQTGGGSDQEDHQDARHPSRDET
jgi:hypothetical protein